MNIPAPFAVIIPQCNFTISTPLLGSAIKGRRHLHNNICACTCSYFYVFPIVLPRPSSLILLLTCSCTCTSGGPGVRVLIARNLWGCKYGQFIPTLCALVGEILFTCWARSCEDSDGPLAAKKLWPGLGANLLNDWTHERGRLGRGTFKRVVNVYKF